jgi:hypothetical protein
MNSTLVSVYRRARGAAGDLTRAVPGAMTMLPRIASVSVQKLLGRSDYGRWSNPASLEKWWDSRTKVIAGLIPPRARVLEFGAGRCQLQHHLPDGCSYVPSDLVPRQPGTIVCDLNHRPLPDLRHVGASVAVFAGVLEYMNDLPSIAQWLARQTGMAIASYDYLKSRPMTAERATELLRRRHFGYHNDCTLNELEATFARAGFQCVGRETWEAQAVLVFATSENDAARPSAQDVRAAGSP